ERAADVLLQQRGAQLTSEPRELADGLDLARARLGVALRAVREQPLLEQFRLAFDERVVHAQVPRLDAELQELLRDPRDRERVLVEQGAIRRGDRGLQEPVR